MGAYLIWWTVITLESVLLLRGTQTRLLRTYPLFYCYIGCVLTKEFIGLLTYQFAPNVYAPLYWPSELVTVLASYGVIVEILKLSTRDKPGLRRLAQNLLLIAFVIAAAYAGSDFLQGRFGSVSRAIADLGRDLRYVEAGVLLVMLWLFARYGIHVGRNLMGLIIGYSFWLGVNVVNLAFWFRSSSEFSIVLRGLLPVTYLMTLLIWCVALWSPQPEPVQASESRMVLDYELLASKTQAILGRTSERLVRNIRP